MSTITTDFYHQGSVELRDTDTYRVRSRLADAQYEIRVARPLPGMMSDPGEAPGLLYVTDGDLFFGTATEVTRLMHQLFGELPPLLVVGIGYGTNDTRVQGETRNRDLTPTEDPSFEEMGRRMSPGWEPLLPEGRRMGRAGPFLDFIDQELDPFLRSRYDVADEAGTLFGSSLGGLFTTWTLLTRPTSFGRYVIVSPALWWDGETLFDLEKAVAGEREDLSARVHITVGEGEEGQGIPGLDRWKLVTNARRMAEALEGRRFPSLRVTFEVLSGESHTSAASVGMTRGLRAVFERPGTPRP